MVRFTTVEASLWPRAASALAALGFNAVDLPLVWREHETAGGGFDLTVGRRSVGAALDAVSAAGLRAVVRVGPMPVPDAAGLGIPDRVLFDRGCQARTRRQNPVVVPDPPRLVPLPSLASAAFRREASAWVTAACTAVAPWVTSGVIARVVLGHGPHALLRDDPFEMDHHPDARGERTPVAPPHHGPQGEARGEVALETDRTRDYLLALVRAATESGIPPEVLSLAISGGVMASATALALAAAYPLVLSPGSPAAGTAGLWRQVRYGSALARGAHWDLRAGNAPFEPPTRATHTTQCARAALTAGAVDYTVVMGCAGDRWVGALLDERAVPRAHAPFWAALNAWAAGLPTGVERVATLVTTAAEVTAARAATAVHPLPLGLLTWRGLTPGELADPAARVDDGTLGAHEADAQALERALTDAGLPWRRAPAGGDGPAYEGGQDREAFVLRARGALAGVTVTVEPAGGALVRAVETDRGLRVMALSAADETVTVHPPEGWGGGAVSLAPGEVVVLSAPPTALRSTAGGDGDGDGGVTP